MVPSKIQRGTDSERAEDFVRLYGWNYKITLKGMGCPEGNEDCLKGKHNHGPQYAVRLFRPKGPKMYTCLHGYLVEQPKHGTTIKYWNHNKDSLNAFPKLYDVLEFVTKAASEPITPGAVWDEYGPLRPEAAIYIAALSNQLRGFLTPEEFEDLKKLTS